MAHLHRRVSIEAPVHEVFAFWRNPVNWPEVSPYLIEVKDVVLTHDGVGTTYNRLHKMAGTRFWGRGKYVEYVPDRRIVIATTGGIESVGAWTFEPDGDRTWMEVDMVYSVPGSLLGKMAESYILKATEHDIDTTLANVRSRLEYASQRRGRP